jgi:hypothetical protein
MALRHSHVSLSVSYLSSQGLPTPCVAGLGHVAFGAGSVSEYIYDVLEVYGFLVAVC